VSSHTSGEEDASHEIGEDPEPARLRPLRRIGPGSTGLPGDVDQTIDWAANDSLKAASPAAARAILAPSSDWGSASSCRDDFEVALSPAASVMRTRQLQQPLRRGQDLRQCWDSGPSLGRTSHSSVNLQASRTRFDYDVGLEATSVAGGRPKTSQKWVQDIHHPRRASAPGDLQLVSLEDDFDIDGDAVSVEPTSLPPQRGASADRVLGPHAVNGPRAAPWADGVQDDLGYLDKTTSLPDGAPAAISALRGGVCSDNLRCSANSNVIVSTLPGARSQLTLPSALSSTVHDGAQAVRMLSRPNPSSGSSLPRGELKIPGTLSEEDASPPSQVAARAAAAATSPSVLPPAANAADSSIGSWLRVRPTTGAAAASRSGRDALGALRSAGRQLVADASHELADARHEKLRAREVQLSPRSALKNPGMRRILIG